MLCFRSSGLPGAALQRLRLIQDHVLPLDPLEILHVLHHQLVTGDHHVEGRVLRVQRFLHRGAHTTFVTICIKNNDTFFFFFFKKAEILSFLFKTPKTHLAPKLPDHFAVVRVPPVRQDLRDGMRSH